jgi:enoyl-CoA hydratase/carnithine racemase
MSHAEGEITTELSGQLFLIGIKRPAKLNGFTPKMMRELAAAYSALEDHAEATCGVLFAHGAHFTAGLDLPSMAPFMQRGEAVMSADDIDPFDLRASASGRRREKPLVAAVRGITYTLGIELMLAADIVVAASDCRFAQLEVKRGIMATGGATIRITERAGIGNANLMMLTGDEFDARDAQRMGLVQRVVEPDQVLPCALEIATRIARQAPLAVRATRLSILRASRDGAEAAFLEFASIQAKLANSADAREGVSSFVERRAPDFKGE